MSNRVKYTIDGLNFKTPQEFYSVISQAFTSDNEPCPNLDAMVDILRGGFGKHKYGEPIEIEWKNSEVSRNNFGYETTIEILEKRLSKCHPSNRERINEQIKKAEQKEGPTFFDQIIECINTMKEEDNYDIILKLN